ncbi:MAG TPA: alkene reductase [Gemmatimonadaceae bacterium]|nr:alkene reductase [Gemmatimonadaceae bacterium]
MTPRTSVSSLFAPIRLGALELPNRLVMAPMTRNRARDDGRPTPMMADYYAQRAGAGLIVTEGVQVSRQGQGYANTPGIHRDDQVEAWRHVTEAVHRRGGRIFAQLWHVGRISDPELQPDGVPVAPSPIAARGELYTARGPIPFPTPRALERDEIPGVIAQFVEGARRARAAGFDGVEIHAANGYLLDQFLRDGTNRRTDEYGGALENRARLLVEVTEALAGAWSAERVGVRISPTNPYNDMADSDPQTTFSYAVAALDGFGLAYLHVTEGPSPASALVTPHLRRHFSGPLMVNGGYDRDSAERMVDGRGADLVSFGVAFLANPDLPVRLAAGAPLNEPDRATFYGGDARGYIDYPTWESATAA